MKISLVSIPVQDAVKAHEIYTSKLGFISKEFDADARSRKNRNKTAVLLFSRTITASTTQLRALVVRVCVSLSKPSDVRKEAISFLE